jgi:hypothetical protein
MEDQQLTKCLQCQETKELEKDAKIDQLLEYMQVEIDLRESALERGREAETHKLRERDIANKSYDYYMYATFGVGLACLLYQHEFKQFMKKTTEKLKE